jgi:hypothetical protein
MSQGKHLQSRMWSMSSSGSCSIAAENSSCRKGRFASRVYCEGRNLVLLTMACCGQNQNAVPSNRVRLILGSLVMTVSVILRQKISS